MEMNEKIDRFMKSTDGLGMSKTFLGRILDITPMSEEEEAQTVLNICRGLRALGLEHERFIRSRYECWSQQLVDQALDDVRAAINKDFRESWFQGDLSSDGRKARIEMENS